ncbi:hypothetical protein M413DRAFT_12546 [Hebeloma cylindrosporum]|uniref:Cyclin N-terminal domain-containing protein n=1 Tax=Hebeloma cylindrosporum TaxID=76867 RepID=A0A0C3C5Q9_HEBCY|nr:hypothetical protein M413DRAFT_12546 [Hebeloma cylindrosporum h7]
MYSHRQHTRSRPPSRMDPSYSQEIMPKLAARFITHLFLPPDCPLDLVHVRFTNLVAFVEFVLDRTQMHPAVTYGALILLQRLRAYDPSTPHETSKSLYGLFLTAFILSCKAMCDELYSSSSWFWVSGDMFTLTQVNDMEKKMCKSLDWDLNVDDPILANFTRAVVSDFGKDRPSYPSYPITFVSKRAAMDEDPIETPMAVKAFDARPLSRSASYKEPASSRSRVVAPNPDIPQFRFTEGNPAAHPLITRTYIVATSSRW